MIKKKIITIFLLFIFIISSSNSPSIASQTGDQTNDIVNNEYKIVDKNINNYNYESRESYLIDDILIESISSMYPGRVIYPNDTNRVLPENTQISGVFGEFVVLYTIQDISLNFMIGNVTYTFLNVYTWTNYTIDIINVQSHNFSYDNFENKVIVNTYINESILLDLQTGDKIKIIHNISNSNYNVVLLKDYVIYTAFDDENDKFINYVYSIQQMKFVDINIKFPFDPRIAHGYNIYKKENNSLYFFSDFRLYSDDTSNNTISYINFETNTSIIWELNKNYPQSLLFDFEIINNITMLSHYNYFDLYNFTDFTEQRYSYDDTSDDRINIPYSNVTDYIIYYTMINSSYILLLSRDALIYWNYIENSIDKIIDLDIDAITRVSRFDDSLIIYSEVPQANFNVIYNITSYEIKKIIINSIKMEELQIPNIGPIEGIINTQVYKLEYKDLDIVIKYDTLKIYDGFTLTYSKSFSRKIIEGFVDGDYFYFMINDFSAVNLYRLLVKENSYELEFIFNIPDAQSIKIKNSIQIVGYNIILYLNINIKNVAVIYNLITESIIYKYIDNIGSILAISGEFVLSRSRNDGIYEYQFYVESMINSIYLYYPLDDALNIYFDNNIYDIDSVTDINFSFDIIYFGIENNNKIELVFNLNAMYYKDIEEYVISPEYTVMYNEGQSTIEDLGINLENITDFEIMIANDYLYTIETMGFSIQVKVYSINDLLEHKISVITSFKLEKDLLFSAMVFENGLAIIGSKQFYVIDLFNTFYNEQDMIHTFFEVIGISKGSYKIIFGIKIKGGLKISNIELSMRNQNDNINFVLNQNKGYVWKFNSDWIFDEAGNKFYLMYDYNNQTFSIYVGIGTILAIDTVEITTIEELFTEVAFLPFNAGLYFELLFIIGVVYSKKYKNCRGINTY